MCRLHEDVKSFELNSQQKTPQRLKLWEMPGHWHCSVIGTCFSHAELVKIARKCDLEIPTGPEAAYKVHSIMVGLADQARGGARFMQKALEAKYKRTLKKFSTALHDDQVIELWAEALKTDNIEAAYWAVMSHGGCSPRLKSRVYGEVHMMSHLAGNRDRSTQTDLQKARANENRLNKDLTKLRRTLLETKKQTAQTIARLKQELSDQTQKAQKAMARETYLMERGDAQIVARLEQRVDLLSHRVVQESEKVQTYKERQCDYETSINALNKQIFDNNARIHALEDELINMAKSAKPCETGIAACTGDEDCDGFQDLCGRCIAYIGGQTKLAAFFRDHVTERNGQFLHHDGGLHDGQAKLQNIIQQADAVMFPVTCISHEASREIKQACIQQEKPFMPLRSKGLGAFRRGLESLEGEFFDKHEGED